MDGTVNPSQYSMLKPTLQFLSNYTMFSQMMVGVNVNYVINMFLLSVIVIYSLMLNDVNE